MVPLLFMTTFNLATKDKQELLSVARRSIEHGLRVYKPLPINIRDFKSPLTEKGACFVTLTTSAGLRGCIGSLEAHQPLVKDVADNAFAAAFRDPRFAPLASFELGDIHIEISVLTPLQEISFTSQQDLLDQIEPFEDGLVIEDGHHCGTFLPLVWKQLPDKRTFLSHLKQKAGLPAGYWSDSLRVYRYHSVVFEEQ